MLIKGEKIWRIWSRLGKSERSNHVHDLDMQQKKILGEIEESKTGPGAER